MECSDNVTPESYVGPVDIPAPLDSENDISYPIEKLQDEEKVHDEVKPKAELTQAVFVPGTHELKQGYRILKELMADANKNVNWPFMDAVDNEATGLFDYYERVKSPMWLKKMRLKFETCQYETITDFVSDFRLMLENCFRYNGPDHWVSKRAQRFETMLEQKLALLSRDLREKTTIEATSGKTSDMDMPGSLRRRGRNISPHNSSALLNQLRREEAVREKEHRKQQILERKATQEAYAQELILWEEKLIEEPIKTQLRHMWELPQIGLFLFLCQEPLNIGEVVQYELERCFAMARESITLQSVMTTLLSTPYQRTRLDRKPLMPYSIWEEKLRLRLGNWYKLFTDSLRDVHMVATKLGVDPYLFTVLGPKNPLDKRKFHELNFFKKIWIVKSLCDHCLVTQDSIRDAIDCQPVEENREYILGYDSEGNTYMHFPQFCGADLRVYKQAPIPHPDMAPITIQSDEEDLEPPIPTKKRKSYPTKSNTKRRKQKKVKEKPVINPAPSSRPSRLRQHIKPVLPRGPVESSSESDSGSDMVSSCKEDSSTCSSTYSVTRFRGRPYLNGRLSSKDNTPEPPSFRGKIRKPRDFESRLHSYSPVFKEWGVSSKEGTPEPVSSWDKTQTDQNINKKSCPRQPSRPKSRRNKRSKPSPKDFADNAMKEADNSMDLDAVPFQTYSDDNSGKNCDTLVEGCNNIHKSDVGKVVNENLSDNDQMKKNSHTDKAVHTKDVINSSGMTENNTSQTNQNGCESIANPNNTFSIKTEPICDSNTDNLTENEVRKIDLTKTETKSPEPVDCEDHKIAFNDIKPNEIKMETGCDDKVFTSSICEQNPVTSQLIDGDKPRCTLGSVSSERDSPVNTSETKSNCLKTEEVALGFAKSQTQYDMQKSVDSSLIGDNNGQVMEYEQCKDESKASISECDLNSCKTKLESSEAVLDDEQAIGGKNLSINENIAVHDHVEPLKDEANSGEIESGNAKIENATEMNSMGKVEEESEEEFDEVSPEIGPFLLVADSVESLRQLVEQFAETKPVVERTKRNKSSKPPPRKRCVVELHSRLLYLLKELEPWDGKLTQAVKRARLKLKKEKMEFIPEEEKKVVEDVWESEESDSEEESSSSDEDENNQKQDSSNKSGIKITNVDPTEVNMAAVSTGVVTDDDMSTSSRGRLRKRKLIPYNSDDTKKRKVVKTSEVNITGHVPNILQRHQVIKADNTLMRNIPISLIEQLKTPALNNDDKKVTSPATLSASQMLLKANLTSKNNVNSLLSSTWSIQTSDGRKMIPLETVQKLLGKGVKAGPTHPVIQQLLAQKVKLEGESTSTYTVQIKPQRVETTVSPSKPAQSASSGVLSSPSTLKSQSLLESPFNIANQLQLAGNKSRKIEIAKARPTAVQLTSTSTGKTSVINKVQHYNQNVLSTLPPELIQQLLKNKSIRIQAVTPDKSNSGNPTGAIIVSPSNKTVQSISITKPTSTPIMATQLTPAVARQTVSCVSQSSAISITPPHSGPITVAPLPDYIVTATQDGLKFKPPSPNKPKYACHVTVKSLLQDRAKKALVFKPEMDGKDSEDNIIVPSAAQVLSLASEVGQQLPAVLEMSSADLNSQPIVVTVNTAIKGLPQTLKLPSKETLDSAVQAVVTSVKTTLPTAHLKVPAPSTMPSIHPRKNVTRTIQSMKSPIPVVHASTSSSQYTPLSSSLAASFQTAPVFTVPQTSNSAVGLSTQQVNQLPLTSVTASSRVSYQVTSPISKPAISPNSVKMISKPVLGLNPGQMSLSNKTDNLMTLSPQTFMTSQGLVQGYLTPQGLVIPQSALQQGSPSKVVIGNPTRGTLQVNATPTAKGSSLPTNNLLMPGKVIRPTNSTLWSGAIPTAEVETENSLNQNVMPVISSKKLLQAINTSVNNNPTLRSENINSETKSEHLASMNSILSGINVKICPGENSVLRQQGIAGEMTNKMSPEIQHINHKGDGIQEKKTHLHTEQILTVAPQITSSDHQGLPAAQVLLSLSQGVLDQTNITSAKSVSSSQTLQHLAKTVVSHVNPLSSTGSAVTLPVNPMISASNSVGTSGNQQMPFSDHSSANVVVSVANQVHRPTENTQKLILLNIGGKLYTSQGIPVTLDNGVLKIAETVLTKQTDTPLTQGHRATQICQPIVQLHKPPAKLVQVPMASKGPVSVQKTVLQSVTTKDALQPAILKEQLITKPVAVSPLKQIHVVGAQNVRQLPQSSSGNLLQHGVGAVKQVLNQSPRIVQVPSQVLGNSISPGSMFSAPGINQQAIQIVGLNNQQQPHLINKANVVHMVLPNTSQGCPVVTRAQQSLAPLIIGGLTPQANQQEIRLSSTPKHTFSADQLRVTQLMSSKLSPNQQLLSPKSVPVNMPIVNNGDKTMTVSRQPVMLQVAPPANIINKMPVQFSNIISPVKPYHPPQ